MITILILRHTHTHIQLLLQLTNASIMEPFRSNKKHGPKTGYFAIFMIHRFRTNSSVRIIRYVASMVLRTLPRLLPHSLRPCTVASTSKGTTWGDEMNLKIGCGEKSDRCNGCWVYICHIEFRVETMRSGSLSPGWKAIPKKLCVCVCVLTKCELLHWLSRLI